MVLGAWADTYDCAARTEYLGIGIWGNRKRAPYIEAKEFEKALSKAVDDEGIKKRVAELRSVCEKAGEGRVNACNRVLEGLD